MRSRLGKAARISEEKARGACITRPDCNNQLGLQASLAYLGI